MNKLSIVCLALVLAGCEQSQHISAVRATPSVPPFSEPLKRPTPKGVTLKIDEDFTDSYSRLAEKLGVQSAGGAAFGERVDRFLASRCIQRFNHAEVNAYMNELVVQERIKQSDPDLIWGWAALRDKDKNENWQWNDPARNRGNGKYLRTAYSGKIPMNVLAIVDAIESEFPGKLDYRVTDYESPRPDPFLSIQATNYFRIIALWDEPSFRPTKTLNGKCD